MQNAEIELNKKKLTELKNTQNRFELLNTETMELIDKINDSLMWGAMEYFKQNNYLWIEVPSMTKITGACENVDTLYALNHFDKKAYLAQTGQLYLEAKIPKHKKVWTTILSSRAEQDVDGRHLNQFTLLEFEQQGGFENLLPTIEGIVQNMVRNVIKHNEHDLKLLGRDVNKLKEYLKPFTRVKYEDAINMLNENGFDLRFGDDLNHKAEMKLIELNDGLPMFITHFPTEIKFFNMRQNRVDSKIVNSADLLMPYSGESAGSAEREDDLVRLKKRLLESNMFAILSKRGIKIDDFADYLNMVERNPILHSGAGIGFNRITQSVLAVTDIRQTNNYPINAETLY